VHIETRERKLMTEPKEAADVFKELKGAKTMFWVASVTFVMMLTTGRMMASNPHMTSAAFLMWCAFIVSDILFVRKAYRTAKAAGFSAIAWGAVTWVCPLSVWALNGKVKRQYTLLPKDEITKAAKEFNESVDEYRALVASRPGATPASIKAAVDEALLETFTKGHFTEIPPGMNEKKNEA
jgi:hypothetical protein